MSLDIRLYGPPETVTCPECGNPHLKQELLFEANITHNLAPMANEAGICEALWNAKGKARELIHPIENAIIQMLADPDRYRKHNPKNGWGSYDSFVQWLECLLDACRRNPDANVEADR